MWLKEVIKYNKITVNANSLSEALVHLSEKNIGGSSGNNEDKDDANH